ncbi:MAG: enoyl-CoA hydratase-related protein [Burkholderiaceae bacterium]
MNDTLLITREGPHAGETELWTLNDPASRNALSEPMIEALFAACARASGDEALRFIVLQGAGGAFCAGGSLGGFAKSIGQALQPGEGDPLIAMNARFGELLLALCQLPQVLIAAVDGPAMGGGFGLVCCADVVVATESAVFATPEVSLGVVPAQIAPFVQWRLGDKAARGVLLGGAKHSAVQMQALGLVDAVVHSDALDSELQQRIDRLRSAAPHAVAASKRLLLMSFMPVVPVVRSRAAIEFAACLRGSEAAEGLNAFAQKRKARWAA